MSEGLHKSWIELCIAALEASDSDELLKIVQDLSKTLKHEEQVLREFREAARANKLPLKFDLQDRESDVANAFFPREGMDSNEPHKSSFH